jgi:hypothetical protein
LTATTRDDPRSTLELVDITTGAETLAGPLAEQPPLTVTGTQRWDMTPRQMVVDSTGIMYAITLSGITVSPIAPATSANLPQVASVVNSADGSTHITPGSFITIAGSSLAGAATATSLPTPTVLGGSCVTFNQTPVPLLSTSNGQILAQVPSSVSPGTNVLQVNSLDYAQQSTPITVTVSNQ